jgi:Zinc-binding loop region of homing endonuclease
MAPLTPKNRNLKNSKTVSPKTFRRLRKTIFASVASKTAHEGFCWLPNQKSNGRGHSQIKFQGVKYLMHRVSACKGNEYVEYNKEEKNDASHLCGYHDCINPEHLHLESASYNQTRDCCHRLGKDDTRYLCPHQPHCVYLKTFTK